jgi:hypothetical protein
MTFHAIPREVLAMLSSKNESDTSQAITNSDAQINFSNEILELEQMLPIELKSEIIADHFSPITSARPPRFA